MARPRRLAPGGVVQHVMNRGSRRGDLFDSGADYIAFLQLLSEARALWPVRIIAYCLMRNHWHLLLWPLESDQLPRFMHWLTGTHARQWRDRHRNQGEGAVYQSRYAAVAVMDTAHLLSVWRYIERNPVEAQLVARAEEWKWSSASASPDAAAVFLLDVPPFPKPLNWLEIVNSSTWDWGTWNWNVEADDLPAGLIEP